jgi:splicing factor 3A subunit 2
MMGSPFESTFLVETPGGKTHAISGAFRKIDDLICRCVLDYAGRGCALPSPRFLTASKERNLLQNVYLMCQGRILTCGGFQKLLQRRVCDDNSSRNFPVVLQLRCRVLGGMDRQNRVGSKFGGGGVSSSAQSERERKERLRKLALESIDLAKDPYLIRNHLGSYECRLCLTLHRDEANYLAHTQGKKHQQGLAHRAYLEKIQQQKDGVAGTDTVSSDANAASSANAPAGTVRKVKIGRPAYQVFKSRDPDTNQRCLSFEVHYPEITDNVQPRHRFMSAFEQRVESPPDRRYQYLLFAADPYETVAFKIPNEPIDKGENRFVTYWDAEAKKFTVSLYFVEPAATTG